MQAAFCPHHFISHVRNAHKANNFIPGKDLSEQCFILLLQQ